MPSPLDSQPRPRIAPTRWVPIALTVLWLIGIGRIWYAHFVGSLRSPLSFDGLVAVCPTVLIVAAFAASVRAQARTRSVVISFLSSGLLVCSSVVPWARSELFVAAEAGAAFALAVGVVAHASFPPSAGGATERRDYVLGVIGLGVLLLRPDALGLTDHSHTMDAFLGVVTVLCVGWLILVGGPNAALGATAATLVTVLLGAEMEGYLAIQDAERVFGGFKPRIVATGFRTILEGTVARLAPLAVVAFLSYWAIVRRRGLRKSVPDVVALTFLLLGFALVVLRVLAWHHHLNP